MPPVIGFQYFQRGRREDLGGVFGLIELIEEMVRQQLYILRTFTQRRQLQWKHLQAVKQIIAQLAARHRFLGNPVGGGNDPYIDFDFPIRAYPHKFVGFEHTQQFDLKFERHFSNFIKKQGAAVGAFEVTGALPHGAGKATLLMAEHFAFDQLW